MSLFRPKRRDYNYLTFRKYLSNFRAIVGRDIRGLIALLRRGKIVAFVEEVAGQLVSEDVEKIEIPNKKVFAKLDLAGLIAEYHALSSIENLHENAQRLKEFRLIDALLVAVENDEQWSRINARRFHLITRLR